MKFLFLSASLLLLSNTALANQDRGFYVGGAGAYLSSETFRSPLDNEDKVYLPALEFVGGFRYNNLVGLDIRMAAGLNERDSNPDTVAELVEYSLDNYASMYYRAELVNEEARLYGLLGYTFLNASRETPNIAEGGANFEKVELSEQGFSYGIGIGWFVDINVTMNVEYRILIDTEEYDFDVVTFGWDYRF